MNIRKFGVGATLAGASVFACVLGGTSAFAEPVPSEFRPLAGMGSDTIEGVMNALSNGTALSVNGVRQVASYNAQGSSTVATKADAACASVARANGSGAGRSALINSLAANNGCLDFARSSSISLAVSNPSVTYVPFAVDAVSYAVTNTSTVSRSLTQADLTAIYHCDSSIVGSAPNYDVRAVLPQAGSGTRSYWLGKVGLTEGDITPTSLGGSLGCLINGSYNNQTIEEHTATFLTDNMIVPFSIGQYNAQATQLLPDKRGRAVLGKIGGTIPQLTNSAFAFNRDVFNIIPTAKVATAPWSTVFVGSGSLMCSPAAQAIAQSYGFGALSGSGVHVCGDSSQATPTS